MAALQTAQKGVEAVKCDIELANAPEAVSQNGAQAAVSEGENLKVAGVTGLEPATSGVTGRRSNRLSYTPYAASASLAAW